MSELEKLKKEMQIELNLVSHFVELADKHQAKADELERKIERIEEDND
jgi:hypothetical protein